VEILCIDTSTKRRPNLALFDKINKSGYDVDSGDFLSSKGGRNHDRLPY
jgi:hypothetical protein